MLFRSRTSLRMYYSSNGKRTTKARSTARPCPRQLVSFIREKRMENVNKKKRSICFVDSTHYLNNCKLRNKYNYYCSFSIFLSTRFIFLHSPKYGKPLTKLYTCGSRSVTSYICKDNRNVLFLCM